MKPSKKDIATLFSNGNFEEVFIYLNAAIVWNIVGENSFEGKLAVVAHCEQIAAYFKTVQTDFKTTDMIVSDNKVVVIGTGEFKRDGEIINLIAACDVYEFNAENDIVKIDSYCIPEKKL